MNQRRFKVSCFSVHICALLNQIFHDLYVTFLSQFNYIYIKIKLKLLKICIYEIKEPAYFSTNSIIEQRPLFVQTSVCWQAVFNLLLDKIQITSTQCINQFVIIFERRRRLFHLERKSIRSIVFRKTKTKKQHTKNKISNKYLKEEK